MDLSYKKDKLKIKTTNGQLGRELGGALINIYIWLSPFAVYLKLSKLLIGYTSIHFITQNKKFLKIKKKIYLELKYIHIEKTTYDIS